MGPGHPVVRALDALLERCLAHSRELWAEHDADWPSVCERGEPNAEGRIRWEPVIHDDFEIFAGLENAIGEPVHGDLKAFYGRHWRHHIDVEAPQGRLSLTGVWNPRDATRLNENLLGHLLQQRRFFGLRRRLPMTLFFATTDADSDSDSDSDSEYVLSLDNHSGEVIVERPGTRDWRVVAAALAPFLDTLQPV